MANDSIRLLQRNLLLAVGCSLTVHGIVLGLLGAGLVTPVPPKPRLERLAVRILARPPTSTPPAVPDLLAPPPRVQPPADQRKRRLSGDALPRQAPALPLRNLPPAQPPVAPALDLEALRAQARSWTGEADRAPGLEHRPLAEPAPLLTARPLLSGLARRLEQGAPALQEQVMADGSRRIVHPGNRCLHVPANVPLWRQGDAVPPQWVVTNC